MPDQFDLRELTKSVKAIGQKVEAVKQTLEEIVMQNNAIVKRLAQVENRPTETNSLDGYDFDFPFNISEALKADDLLEYIQNRNADIQATRKRSQRTT